MESQIKFFGCGNQFSIPSFFLVCLDVICGAHLLRHHMSASTTNILYHCMILTAPTSAHCTLHTFFVESNS